MSDSTTRVATGLAATAPPPQVGSVPALEAVSGPTDALLERFLADRVPHLRDTLVGLTIVAVLLANPRGLLPERVQVSRWLDRRVRSLRRAENEATSSAAD